MTNDQNIFFSHIGALVTLAASISVISGCARGPIVQDFPDTASAPDEVSRFDADMNVALGNQVNVLSPQNYKAAQSDLLDAKDGLDKHPTETKAILHHVAEGRAYLSRANEVAKVSNTNMEEVVTARQQAIDAGAPLAFSADFHSADDQLRDVTKDVENNDVSSAARNRGTLQAQYLDLELRAIKQASLAQSRDTIAQAVKEGAKELAPRTLAIAEKNVKDTDAYITANRHEVNEIHIRSLAALASADHLLKITRDSITDKKTSPEETALQMESEKSEVAYKNNELMDKQEQISRKEEQLTAEQTQNQTLEKEQAIDRSFEEASAEFSPNEAEVYKQGNVLMIRLKGLNFPASQAVLKGENFPLLAKVQKVIKDFGTSTVIVEGHTDSNGGKALNDRLSAERAEAVRQYLIANDEGKPVKITAVGYGYEKPLASNKTSLGRAQNRRVDVLIQRD